MEDWWQSCFFLFWRPLTRAPLCSRCSCTVRAYRAVARQGIRGISYLVLFLVEAGRGVLTHAWGLAASPPPPPAPHPWSTWFPSSPHLTSLKYKKYVIYKIMWTTNNRTVGQRHGGDPPPPAQHVFILLLWSLSFNRHAPSLPRLSWYSSCKLYTHCTPDGDETIGYKFVEIALFQKLVQISTFM